MVKRLGYQARMEEALAQIDKLRDFEGDKSIAARVEETISTANAVFGEGTPDARAIRDAYDQEYPKCDACGGRTTPSHRKMRDARWYHDTCPGRSTIAEQVERSKDM